LHWQPSADPGRLRLRAALLARIREFFAARGVLEVQTPLLGRRGVTDPAIEPLMVVAGASLDTARYLQTSPEYAMKRLLAAHGEPIYQIAGAFRDGEIGPRHNPEFTLLEWYRPGFDHFELMAEVADLVRLCIGEQPVSMVSYRALFREHLGLDPLTATTTALEAVARAHVDTGAHGEDRDLWLDLLMSHVLEPRLPVGMCFVHDYPPSQAALARTAWVDGVEVALRFELFIDGLEIANGYRELTDPAEQRRRFEADNVRRRAHGQPERPPDERLLAALQYGLPDCAGVALGVDRLLMVAAGATSIGEVLAFDWERG